MATCQLSALCLTCGHVPSIGENMSNETGPSTEQTPYITPTAPGVHLVPLLSAGDTAPDATHPDGSAWRFVGIPDGIGAFDNNDGTITILINHELNADAGGEHDSGSKSGSFVDRITINKQTLEVVDGRELATRIYFYDPVTKSYVQGTDAIARLCSADLPVRSALYDAQSGKGTQAHILLNGEESGTEGRAFAWIGDGSAAGTAYELPALGNLSFENILVSPSGGEKTIAIENEDTAGGQLYVYVGDKQATGNDVERAGLTNGVLYGIKSDFLKEVSDGQALSGTFSLAPLGDVTDRSGAQLQSDSDAAGVTGWLRPEDGAWDTQDPNRYYFVTTNAFDAPSRLWALDFKDSRHPELGGTYTALLDGSEGQKMLDNITVSADGTLVLQEDVGENARAGRVWQYDPKTDALTQLAQHDVARFGDETIPPTSPFTDDEESSGVLDVSALFNHAPGQKVFLLDTQAHYPFGADDSTDRQQIVQGGQLQLMYVDSQAKGLDWNRHGGDDWHRHLGLSDRPHFLGKDNAFPTLDGSAPLVFGHRGAAGSRPEHTLEGYKYAIKMGADFIEPDVVPTKDGYLIARHEPEMGGTTDVKDHPEFADRFTTKVIDGTKVSGWFAEDFTLAEIKTLYARERIPDVRPTNTQYNDQYRIPTLDEVVDLVKQTEAETGRQIGLIPETKHPTYFKYEGTHLDGSPIHTDTSQLLVDALVRGGFTDHDRVIIQSFETANLIDLKTRIMPAANVDLQIVQLMNEGGYDITFNFDAAKAPLGANPDVYKDLNFTLSAQSPTNGDLYTPDFLKAAHDLYADEISPYKDDILPVKTLAAPVDGNGDGVPRITREYTGDVTSLVKDAHDAGLKVIPYTLRNEESFQTLNPDGSVADYTQEYRNLIAAGVDGFFTDFPGTGRQVVDALIAGHSAGGGRGGSYPHYGGHQPDAWSGFESDSP